MIFSPLKTGVLDSKWPPETVLNNYILMHSHKIQWGHEGQVQLWAKIQSKSRQCNGYLVLSGTLVPVAQVNGLSVKHRQTLILLILMNIWRSAKSSKSSWLSPYHIPATHWDFVYSEIIGSMTLYLDIWCRYSTSPPVTKVHLEKSVWISAYGFITCYCLVCRFDPGLWLRLRSCDDHHDISFRPTRKLYNGDSFQLITKKHPKHTTTN